MIGAFFAWWIGQLAELLPSWLRRPTPINADALVVEPAGSSLGAGAIAVAVRAGGREQPLGRFTLGSPDLGALPPARNRPAVIRLRDSDVLEKTLVLPLPALSELEQVLVFEMDRETPFAADEVYWTHHVTAIDRQQGKLSVRLLVLPKVALAPLLAALAQAGITPSWAEIGDGPRRLHFPLGTLHGRRQGSRRLVLALVACCAVLAVAAMVVPFVRQAAVLATLDREIARARATAGQAEALRREIDQLSRSAMLIKRERDAAGRPLEVLAAVTRLLPDDTYLTELELRHRKLTLAGRSGGAARLIGALAADRQFRNLAFAAPVTRIEALKAEVFTIVADTESPP